MRRIRNVLVASLFCGVWWACTEGTPTGSGRAISVAIVPNFQVDPALFSTDPIDGIRLTARDASTDEVVGSTNQTVSPTATEWVMSLGIELGGATSREIIVDAELLSGATVVWSGRLGPFTVPSSTGARTLDVYPGPLDNQDVLQVDILGAPAQLAVDASATLTSNVVLQPASAATPVVLWASTDASVATVTPQGSTVTLTAISLGSADIIATAGPAYDEFTFQVVPPATYTKAWVGGAVTGSPTDWDNPANWSPAGVPGGSDVVLVGVVSNRPVLSTSTIVGSITVGNSNFVDMNTFTLTVVNDVDAGSFGILNGTVIVTGAGSMLRGNFDALQISADRALSGFVTTSGDVSTAADLDVNDQLLDVGGSLLVSGPNAHLIMPGVASSVSVGADVTFSGGSHTGLLPGGVLAVEGDFNVSNSSATGFPPGPSHVTAFSGSGPQSVVFGFPASGQQSFGSVTVANAAGVSFDSDAFTTGNAIVTGRMVVPATQTFTVGGSMTLNAGSEFHVDGTLTAAGGCVNAGATITGTGSHPCGSGPAGDFTWVGGAAAGPNDWNNPNNWTPVGVPGPSNSVLVGSGVNPVLAANSSIADITVAGVNNVDLNGFTLTVAGDVDLNNNGLLNGMVQVTGPGTLLQGTVQSLQLSADRSLSGQLFVRGDLQTNNTLNINGQSASIGTNLVVQGPNALLIMTDPATVIVAGDALFNGGDHSDALTAGSLAVAGNLTVSDASPTAFVSSGTHTVSLYGGTAQAVAFGIPGAAQQRLNDVTVSGLAGVTFSTDAHATGDVTVTGRLIVPAGTTTTIDGTLTLFGGALFEVYGTVVVNGAGVCDDQGAVILGNGTQPCGAPSTADRVWSGGDSADPTGWSNPNNWIPVGVPTSVETVLIATTGNPPVLSTDQTVAGIEVLVGTFLDLATNTLTVAGDVRADAGILNGTTVVTGTGTVLQGAFEDFLLTAPRDLTGTLIATDELIIRDRLSVGPYAAWGYGSLILDRPNSELVLDDPAGSAYSLGDALFDGASLSGDLTAGALWVAGDFTAEITNSFSSFQATGTTVYFIGDTDQTVTFANPGVGATEQSFSDVQLIQSGGSVIFESDAFVTGALLGTNQVLRQGAGAATLEVQGQLVVSSVTFDGLPLRLVSSVAPNLHTIASPVFANMATDVSQLFVSLVGADITGALTISAPQFSATPPSPGYYIEGINSAVGVPDLFIVLTTPIPVDDGGATNVDTRTQIIWGP